MALTDIALTDAEVKARIQSQPQVGYQAPLAVPNSITANGAREDNAYKVKAIIASALGDQFGTGAYKRTHLLTDKEDSINIMVAILLKFETKEIKEFVNNERVKRHLEPIQLDKRDIYNFKKVYANAIDNAWIATATFIGDLYPMADKLHRIGVLNDIVVKLKPAIDELMFPDDMILKKVNLLIKALDRIDNEMGKASMTDQLKPRNYTPEPEENLKITKGDLKDFFNSKFGNQLPQVADVNVNADVTIVNSTTENNDKQSDSESKEESVTTKEN